MTVPTQTHTNLKARLEQLAPFIGDTPLYPLQNVYQKEGVLIYAKLEWQQLGHSVKARAAFSIFQEAIRSGALEGEKHLLDATSGNTGIAYATIGAALGIPVTLCLPANASEGRKIRLKALGAKLIETSPLESTDGAQEKARQLATKQPDQYVYVDQYANDRNWKAHYHVTAEEIEQQTEGKVTHFVAGLGTSGTFMGTGRKLKELHPDIELTALQPELPLHGLEGWKHMETAQVPAFYDPALADQFLEVNTQDSFDMLKKVAHEEGLLLSPSSAANLVGALQVAKQIDRGTIVTVFPDNAANYQEVLNKIF